MKKMQPSSQVENPEYATCPSCEDKPKRYFCPACNGTRVARCYRCHEKVPFGVWVFRGKVKQVRVFVCRECSIASGLGLAPDLRVLK